MTSGPTLRDVAERAGVAAITASRILNGSKTVSPISPATRQRVERAAADLGYRLDAVARAMRHRRSCQIGVVVANAPGQMLANLPAYEYILGLNSGLEADGYVVSLVRLTDVDGGRPERVRALEERLLEALVVLGHMPPAVIAHLRQRQQRIVWLDTEVDEPTCCLRRDEFAAGQDAAGLLLGRGRTRIVWPQRPSGLRNHYSQVLRVAGARAACEAAGVEFATLDLDDAFLLPDPAAAQRLLSRPGCGLLLSDPTMTRRMQTLLLGFGLVPGRDLGVAGCDGDSHIATAWPELSRVAVDRAGIGLAAAAMMHDLLGGDHAPASRLICSPTIAGLTA